MSASEQPLIVGAGPAGLGAGLFLTGHGIIPRIVEQLDEPSKLSKALAVNPRTLEILEPVGVTGKMLEQGKLIHGVRFYRNEHNFATFPLDNIHPKYPFMLALSQAATERLLSEALETSGGKIERGVKMTECRNLNDQVEATLTTPSGHHETIQCPWMLACDGAHSTARSQSGLGFAGTSFKKEWHLADVPLKTSLAEDHVHIFFLDNGTFLFMLRVIDPALESPVAEPVWRIMANDPNPLAKLAKAEPAATPLWQSSFHIAHRLISSFSEGNIYFAGDAAHIHSPVGARGMNLGLEDARVFAELAKAGRLPEYHQLRYSIDRQVVNRVRFISRIAAPESLFRRFLRTFLFPLAIRIPFVRDKIRITATGLDHPLPELTMK